MQIIPRTGKFINMDLFLLDCMQVYKEVKKPVRQFIRNLFDCSDLSKKNFLHQEEYL